MSQEFKFKYDRMRENDPAAQGNTDIPAADGDKYPSHSNTRNLDFVQLDGKRFFRNYSFLVGADFDPAEQKISLEFTSCMVIITGQKLELLYQKLMEQIPRIIAATDGRYNSVGENDEPIVNKIIIQLNK